MTIFTKTLQPKIAGMVFFVLALFGASVLRPVDGLAADPRYVRQTPGAARVIVFVHGVLGNGTSTWTAPNKAYWPDIVTKDPAFADFDIYVYEYPTTMIGSTFSIDEIADSMRLFFDSDSVSSHSELIFIAHSMGGLAVRAYLTKYRDVASKTRLIYFYSTPTTGSEIGSLASLISKNPQLAEMRPMQSVDYLAILQRQWLAADFKIASYCAYETRPTYGINVVTQASSSNLCNKRLDPIDEDHINIVKPDGMRHPSYLAFKSALSQTPPLRASNEKSGGETEDVSKSASSGLDSPSTSTIVRQFRCDTRESIRNVLIKWLDRLSTAGDPIARDLVDKYKTDPSLIGTFQDGLFKGPDYSNIRAFAKSFLDAGIAYDLHRGFTATDTFGGLLKLNSVSIRGHRFCDGFTSVAKDGANDINSLVTDFVELSLFSFGKGPSTMVRDVMYTTGIGRTDKVTVAFAITPTSTVERNSAAKAGGSLFVGRQVTGGGSPSEQLAVIAIDQVKSRSAQ
jgi:pimeloyl-ACP methyl ester carboxylesterase